jgi:hypothetical protein
VSALPRQTRIRPIYGGIQFLKKKKETRKQDPEQIEAMGRRKLAPRRQRLCWRMKMEILAVFSSDWMKHNDPTQRKIEQYVHD